MNTDPTATPLFRVRQQEKTTRRVAVRDLTRILAQTAPRAGFWPVGLILRKKGLRRKAEIPFGFALVPKAGFEPARVSPPPPQTDPLAVGEIGLYGRPMEEGVLSVVCNSNGIPALSAIIFTVS